MLDNDREALKHLEPPPGGIARFENRLDRLDSSPRTPVSRPLALGAAALLLVALVMIVVGEPDIEATPSVYQAPAFDRLLGRPMDETPTSISIDDEPVSASLIANSDSNIRIYEIERE